MRLDNGAINCAGQGHNEAIVGVDNAELVCIVLRQNGLTTSTASRIRAPLPRHRSGNPVRDTELLLPRPRVASPDATRAKRTTTLPSYYPPIRCVDGVSPVDMEDKP